MNKVFVYGTLKRGFGNHRLLANAKFIGPAMLAGNHTLLDSGFPVCMHVTNDKGEGGVVLGEVYAIDTTTLRWLDRLESEGAMYNRLPQEVVYQDGTAEVVWVYIGAPAYWHGTEVGEQWRREYQFFVYDGRRPDDELVLTDADLETELWEWWEDAMEADMARNGVANDDPDAGGPPGSGYVPS